MAVLLWVRRTPTSLQLEGGRAQLLHRSAAAQCTKSINHASTRLVAEEARDSSLDR